MKLSSSYISLNRLRFHARHGVLPQERATGGEFIVSVRAKYLFDKALESDNVDDTINYAEIFEIINKKHFQQNADDRKSRHNSRENQSPDGRGFRRSGG